MPGVNEGSDDVFPEEDPLPDTDDEALELKLETAYSKRGSASSASGGDSASIRSGQLSGWSTLTDEPVDDYGQLEYYVLGLELGAGAFGKVYGATHVLSNQEIAIKVCDRTTIKNEPDGENREYQLKYFYREVDILKSLRHPNILWLIEVIDAGDKLYIVTERAEHNLEKYIKKNGAYSEPDAEYLTGQLVMAVEYLHKKGVVHRDIKPDNLMLDFDGHLKLIDFGLSNWLGPDNLLMTQCGTLHFSAPEMLANKHYGPEVDVWSIGICLYFMITVDLPFSKARNLTEIHAMQLDTQVILPPESSEDLKDLLQGILQRKPADRLTIAEIQNHMWMKQSVVKASSNIRSTGSSSQFQPAVIAKMCDVGLGPEDTIKESVAKNKCDERCATYNLFCMRRPSRTRIRRGSSSGLVRKSSVSSDPGTQDTRYSLARRRNLSVSDLPVDQMNLTAPSSPYSRSPTSTSPVFRKVDSPQLRPRPRRGSLSGNSIPGTLSSRQAVDGGGGKRPLSFRDRSNSVSSNPSAERGLDSLGFESQFSRSNSLSGTSSPRMHSKLQTKSKSDQNIKLSVPRAPRGHTRNGSRASDGTAKPDTTTNKLAPTKQNFDSSKTWSTGVRAPDLFVRQRSLDALTRGLRTARTNGMLTRRQTTNSVSIAPSPPKSTSTRRTQSRPVSRQQSMDNTFEC